jgi:multidrug efflux pump subunit AcrA (membrane-fusion protein)
MKVATRSKKAMIKISRDRILQEEKANMKHFLIIAFVISAGLLLSACGGGAQTAATSTPIPTVIADNTIIAEGRLEPVHYVDIAFNANGTVSDVLVSDGEQVKAGQVIARLENSEAKQAEVAKAEEDFLTAQQAFDSAEVTVLGKLAEAHESVRKAQYELDNFDIPSDLRNMSTTEAMTFTATKLDEARVAFEPYRYMEERLTRELSRENPSNPDVYRSTAKNYKKRLDDAWADYNKAIQWATLESNLENAQAELTKNQKEYDLLSSGSNAGDKAVAEAQYEAARANLDAARAALADVELTAPFDGTVAGLKVKTGETVTPGQIAASVADLSGWIVKTTDLTELDVVKISEEQPVAITLDAIPDQTLEGKVLRIGQNYSEKQGDIVYEVTVQVTEALPTMRWGMTSVVKFSE